MRGLSWWAAPEKIQLTLQTFVIELTKVSLGGCLLIWILHEVNFFLKIKIARRKKKIASTENYSYRFKKPNPQSCHNFRWFANVHYSFLALFCLATFQKKLATSLFFRHLNWIKIPVVPMGILQFISTLWVLGLFFYNNQFLHYFFSFFPLFLPHVHFLLLSHSLLSFFFILHFIFCILYVVFYTLYFFFTCV